MQSQVIEEDAVGENFQSPMDRIRNSSEAQFRLSNFVQMRMEKLQVVHESPIQRIQREMEEKRKAEEALSNK